MNIVVWLEQLYSDYGFYLDNNSQSIIQFIFKIYIYILEQNS